MAFGPRGLGRTTRGSGGRAGARPPGASQHPEITTTYEAGTKSESLFNLATQNVSQKAENKHDKAVEAREEKLNVESSRTGTTVR
ncbi:hypothetical protein FRB93_000464 [Tulasnella sp. JGI-2019a]|nr:hypothetical protein FRB93_000464 [Tulasnella sp. JGI-2019a]